MNQFQRLQMILYVSNQQISMEFYQKLLRRTPDLHVPGMTEFVLSDTCKIGLMPSANIAQLLKETTPHPDSGHGIPRCELYFYVENVTEEYEHAKQVPAKLVSPLQQRDWGDLACYFADPDGHIIAFAQKN